MGWIYGTLYSVATIYSLLFLSFNPTVADEANYAMRPFCHENVFAPI